MTSLNGRTNFPLELTTDLFNYELEVKVEPFYLNIYKDGEVGVPRVSAAAASKCEYDGVVARIKIDLGSIKHGRFDE